jgi:putative hydroxymethylpyrimidine transport system substrate-binding protein
MLSKPMLSRRLLLATAAIATLPAFAQSAKYTVLLDWFVNPDHLPLIVASEGGYFAKAGLDVTLIAPTDPSAPPRLVAAKQADVAVSYQPNLYLHVKEKLPLSRIGTCVATPLNTLVVLEDGAIKTLADLKGKTIGFSIGGFEDALLATMLSGVGLTLKDVKLVNVNFALTGALVSGKVDAVIGAFRNFELTQLEIAGKKGKAFYPEELGVPVYDELIYVAHNDTLKDARHRKFIDALEAATIFMLNNPAKAWAMFIKAHPKLDDKLNKQAFADTLPRFTKSPGALDRNRYNRFAAYMKAQGLITEVPALDTYAVEL